MNRTELYKNRVRIGSLLVEDGKAKVESEEYSWIWPLVGNIGAGESFRDRDNIVFRRRQMNDDEVVQAALGILAHLDIAGREHGRGTA